MWFSTGGKKCSRGPLWPLPQQAVAAGDGSCHRRAFPTCTASGHQRGVCNHADTRGTTVRQQHHPEVTSRLSFPCGHLTHRLLDFCKRFLFSYTHFFHLWPRCSAQKENTKKVNMKRENKAYSYKEQIIELELQEVEWSPACVLMAWMSENIVWICLSLFCSKFQEMKKKKGIKDEVQLTSKQKEMMQIQLEKESAIRKRLQGVWIQFSKSHNSFLVSQLFFF